MGLPELLIWLNDHPLSWLLTPRKVGSWWVSRQPWHWIACRIIHFHRRHRPQQWVLTGGGHPFWMRPG